MSKEKEELTPKVLSEGNDMESTTDKIKTPGYCSAVCVDKASMLKEIEKSGPKTSDIYATCNLPKRFEYPHWFNGYGSQVSKQHPFYRTTASDYGWFPPGYHSIPSVYYPLDTQFAESMIRSGMYRNYSLNMSAPDPPTKMCSN